MTRNVRCPKYSGCLDAALSLGMTGWTCTGCKDRFQEDTIDEIQVERSARLVSVILELFQDEKEVNR